MLTKKLAAHYKALWIPEYAREYIDQLNHPYTAEDIENIARSQLEAEKKAEKSNENFLFCDTELIVCKIWAEYKFGHCPSWITEQIRQNAYDLILLTNIDLPWQPDPQREHPDKRKFFFEWFRKELDQLESNYQVVSGLGDVRFQNAKQIIDPYLQA